MSIEADLRKQLTEAIRAKDLRTANIIRMVNTKVMERRTARGFSGEVDDALYLDVIGAYRKSLEKARKEFEAAGARGAEPIAELDFEIAALKGFLAGRVPEELAPEELRAAVREAIAELGVTDPKMAGRVVGQVMKKHKGRAEPAAVKQMAEEELGRAPE
jgi:uncharacterized protein